MYCLVQNHSLQNSLQNYSSTPVVHIDRNTIQRLCALLGFLFSVFFFLFLFLFVVVVVVVVACFALDLFFCIYLPCLVCS